MHPVDYRVSSRRQLLIGSIIKWEGTEKTHVRVRLKDGRTLPFVRCSDSTRAEGSEVTLHNFNGGWAVLT